MADAIFEGWAILELMGHRRLAGYVQEATIAGGAFIRIDVAEAEIDDIPEVLQNTAPNDATATQFYSPAAVYCITPTTERIARAVARGNKPAPVQRWELEPAPVFAGRDENLEDDRDDDPDDEERF
jgi:hypothetical protein